ncbi:hypothetical protein D3C84_467520 [compost metagenome]
MKGLLLVINIIPLKAFAPYSAEEAPGKSSTLATSISEIPIKLPNTKFNAGDELSIPSTNCIKRVFATVAKPRVLIDLNEILLVLKFTSFKFSKPS